MYQSRCPNLEGLHFSVVEIQTIILLSYLDVQILMVGNLGSGKFEWGFFLAKNVAQFSSVAS